MNGQKADFHGDNIMWHQPVGSTCYYWGLNEPTTEETVNAFQWVGQPPKLPLPGRDLKPI